MGCVVEREVVEEPLASSFPDLKKMEKQENLRAFPLSSDDQKNLEVVVLPSCGGSRPSVCPLPHRPRGQATL